VRGLGDSCWTPPITLPSRPCCWFVIWPLTVWHRDL